MANIPQIPSTPPKKPIAATEKEGSKSIPAKFGWKREVNQEEGTAVPRAKQSGSGEVAQEAPDLAVFSEQFLSDDVLNLVAKMSRITDVAALKEASKTLNEIVYKTDLEKLKKYSETHQLNLKDQLALSFIILWSQTALKPAVGDITSRAEVDVILPMEKTLESLLNWKIIINI